MGERGCGPADLGGSAVYDRGSGVSDQPLKVIAGVNGLHTIIVPDGARNPCPILVNGLNVDNNTTYASASNRSLLHTPNTHHENYT